jgi:hypothetical protein
MVGRKPVVWWLLRMGYRDSDCHDHVGLTLVMVGGHLHKKKEKK